MVIGNTTPRVPSAEQTCSIGRAALALLPRPTHLRRIGSWSVYSFKYGARFLAFDEPASWVEKPRPVPAPVGTPTFVISGICEELKPSVVFAAKVTGAHLSSGRLLLQNGLPDRARYTAACTGVEPAGAPWAKFTPARLG